MTVHFHVHVVFYISNVVNLHMNFVPVVQLLGHNLHGGGVASLGISSMAECLAELTVTGVLKRN